MINFSHDHPRNGRQNITSPTPIREQGEFSHESANRFTTNASGKDMCNARSWRRPSFIFHSTELRELKMDADWRSAEFFSSLRRSCSRFLLASHGFKWFNRRFFKYATILSIAISQEYYAHTQCTLLHEHHTLGWYYSRYHNVYRRRLYVFIDNFSQFTKQLNGCWDTALHARTLSAEPL